MKIGQFVDMGEIEWKHHKQFTAGNVVVQLNKADTKIGTIFSLRAGRLFYSFAEKKESFNHFVRATEIDDVINLLKAAKEYIAAVEKDGKIPEDEKKESLVDKANKESKKESKKG